ncbi:MAG: type II secretion system protein [Patescibacteria group bacterium]
MKWRAHKQGFTIVELLIVIVVIGILAAITMVAFNAVQSQARTNRVNSDLSALKKAMLTYKASASELPPVGDSWNYATNPPTCSTWDAVRTALSGVGIGGTISTTDPWGNCYGYDDNDCNTASGVGSQTNVRSVGPDGLNNTGDEIILIVATKVVAC